MYERTMPPVMADFMYEGGFKNSSGAIKLAFEHFGLVPPLTLYYPGSDTDVSLVGIEGVDTIHADLSLDEQRVGAFAVMGAEAHAEDVHIWQPKEPVDAIVFINPTSIDERLVVELTDLREDGLVVWASGHGRPVSLARIPSLALVGVIDYDRDRGLTIDQNNLVGYFKQKTFQDLTETERQDFIQKLENYKRSSGLSSALSHQELFDYLRITKSSTNLTHLENMGYALPYEKNGAFYVFQKRSNETA